MTQEKQSNDCPRCALGDGSHPILEGGIWASCGCKLTDDDGPDGMGFDTITLGDDCDFYGVHRCAYFGSACRKCRGDMQARNMLATRDEADAWIKNGILPERMREPSANVKGVPRSGKDQPPKEQSL